MKQIILLLIIIALCNISFGASTRTITDDTKEALMAGEAKNVSITSNGELILSPAFAEKVTLPEPVVWAMVTDGSNIYMGTGHEGKVYKYSIGSNALSIIFDSEEMEVMALALDRSNTLYVGTSPNGKIYKMNKNGEFAVFSDIGEKNIFAMTCDKNDNVIVGTGMDGKVYSINKAGESKVLYDSSELCITSLQISESNSILAGSYPGGILYEIFSDDKNTVLYDSDLEQVSSIAMEGGNIYFSVVGSLKTPQPGISIQATPQETITVVAESETTNHKQETTVDESKKPKPSAPPFMDMRAKRSSIVYRISSDGYAEQIYRTNESSILASAIKDKSSLIISVAANNSLMQIDDVDEYSLLLTGDSIVSSIINEKGKLWFVTSNPSILFGTETSYSKNGGFISKVYDTKGNAKWGSMSWKEKKAAAGDVRFYTRTGNTSMPDENWSKWSSAYSNSDGDKIQSPSARFIQYKCELQTSDVNKSPVVRNISFSYLEQNIKPYIASIEFQAPGIVYKKIQSIADDKKEETGAPSSSLFPNVPLALLKAAPQLMAPFQKGFKPGWQTVTWNASDANGDKLLFDIYYANVDDMSWRKLMSDIEENYFSWDSTMLPDGNYYLRIHASDRDSNPEEFALSAYKISNAFTIDNSQPEIKIDSVVPGSGAASITLTVSDKLSSIKSVEYALDIEKWYVLFPVDSVFDSNVEKFEFSLKDLKKGKNSVIIRVRDAVNNTNTQHVSFDIK